MQKICYTDTMQYRKGIIDYLPLTRGQLARLLTAFSSYRESVAAQGSTGSLMPGMNATAALDIPPCRRYVVVKATAGFAVCRLILKLLLFYSCLDFTQNLGETLTR